MPVITQSAFYLTFLCRRPNGSHDGPFLYLSSDSLQVSNSKIKGRIQNQNWCEHFPGYRTNRVKHAFTLLKLTNNEAVF